MKHSWLVAVMVTVSTPCPVAAQAPSVQQQFDAASDALANRRWQEALSQFEALEARVSSRQSLAVVRVRKATALFQLQRPDEAMAALRLGLPDLAADNEGLSEVRFVGLQTLAEIEELALDYAAAHRHYLEAKAVPVSPGLRLAVYRGLIQTRMFDDPAGALTLADEGLALAQQLDVVADGVGIMRTMRGRALLNLGRIREARAELERAVEGMGGMTAQVNLADIVARSDRAIAALLDGDEDAARHYLAFTGAGQYDLRAPYGLGNMQAPQCGGDLRPEDLAVIEFSIRSDGLVGHATPIYTSRPGPSAIGFARAVRNWAWDPEQFSETPVVLRSAIRIELHCTLSPTLEDEVPFSADETRRWAQEKGISLPNPLARQRPPAELRQELASSRSGAEPARRLETLLLLGVHPIVGADESARYLREAFPIAVAERAPPLLVAQLAVLLAADERAAGSRSGRSELPDFEALLSLPVIQDDARAQAAIRLVQAESLFARNDDVEAAAHLAQVRAAGLADDDPLTVQALKLEVRMAASREDWAAAETAFRALGPAADPCALPPRMRRLRTSNNDFPRDAIMWGFEGWATVDPVIDRSGEVGSARTVMSYPPFVFGPAAQRLATRSRFESAFLPDGVTCTPATTVIHFRITQ